MQTYTDDPHVFWGDQDWPKDDVFGGNVFLARAMMAVGSALFREAWNGNEARLSLTPRALPSLPPMPRPLVLPPIPRPLVTVQRSQPEPEPQTDEPASDNPWWGGVLIGRASAPPPRPLVIEHDPAVSLAIEAAKTRWTEVMRATEYFLNGGWLPSSWRPLYGGKLEEIVRTDWFTEEEINWRRFLLCRIDHRPEFRFTGPAAGPAFIYVSSKALNNLLDSLHAHHPDAAEQPTEANGKAALSKAMVADAVAALYGKKAMPIAKTRDHEIAAWLEKNRDQNMAGRTIKRHLKALHLIG